MQPTAIRFLRTVMSRKIPDVYTTGYLPDETFDGFLTELLKSSYKDTGVAVGKDDKVLTLSTCSGDGLAVCGTRCGLMNTKAECDC